MHIPKPPVPFIVSTEDKERQRKIMMNNNTLNLTTKLFENNFSSVIRGELSVDQLSLLCIEAAKKHSKDIENLIQEMEKEDKK